MSPLPVNIFTAFQKFLWCENSNSFLLLFPPQVLLLLFAALASAAALPAPVFEFFPGPFERPNSGPDEVFPECADDGDLSDCSPEDRAFFKFDPADVRHAGARGMLVYSNGAVVPVEGPALVVSFVNFVFFKKNLLYHAQCNIEQKTRSLHLSALNVGLTREESPQRSSEFFPTVVKEINYGELKGGMNGAVE